MTVVCDICGRSFGKNQAMLVHRRYHDAEYRKWRDELNARSEVRARRSAVAKRVQNDPNVRAKYRVTTSTDAYRRCKSAVQKEAQNRPDVRAKRAATQATEEYKKKQREVQLVAQNRPEVLEKQSKARAKAIVEGRVKLNSWGKQGKFESRKAGIVHYRSLYELKAFQRLDACDAVTTFVVEPYSIPYEFECQSLYCIPDVVVDQVTMIEIKPAFRLKEAKTMAKVAAMKKYCEDKGLRFELWTEDELGLM